MKNINIILALFVSSLLFFGCGSDSENEDILNEWTIVEMQYSGTSFLENLPEEKVDFTGRLIKGNPTFQLNENPNTGSSSGDYIIELTSVDQNGDVTIELAKQSVMTDGNWTRVDNILTFSGEDGNGDDNSFDYTIDKVTEEVFELSVSFSGVSEMSGLSIVTSVDLTYFMVRPSVINGWVEKSKGDWILDDASYTKLNGYFTGDNGPTTDITRGEYTSGTCPIRISSDKVESYGSYNLDVVTTNVFGEETMSTLNVDFIQPGGLEISGSQFMISGDNGVVEDLTVIEANDTELKIRRIQSNKVDEQTLYDTYEISELTFSRKEFVPEPELSLIGNWDLVGMDSNLSGTITLNGLEISVSQTSVLKSSNNRITFNESPNNIISQGEFVEEVTDVTTNTVSENTGSFGNFDSWIQEEDLIKVTKDGEELEFEIVEFSNSRLILKSAVEISENNGGILRELSGEVVFTFQR